VAVRIDGPPAGVAADRGVLTITNRMLERSL
jgi:hypothetical protein